MDGVDEAAEHQAVPVVPAARFFVWGRIPDAAHDVHIGMLWIGSDFISGSSRNQKMAWQRKALTTISCKVTFHMASLMLGVSKKMPQALSWIAAFRGERYFVLARG